MSILDAVPGVSQAKLIGGGICLLGIIGLGIYIWGLKTEIKSEDVKISQLTSDNKQLTENISIMKSNFSECQSANALQNDTINSFIKERADTQVAISNLSSKASQNELLANKLKKQLQDLNATAGNNGTIAKNLRETIRSIQNKGVQK